MVYKKNRGLVVALDGAERGEHGRDLCRGVLVDTRNAYKRIEDEQTGTMGIDGGAEAEKMIKEFKEKHDQAAGAAQP